MNIVVLISANAEWQAVKKILSPGIIEVTPLGETFNLPRGANPHETGTLETTAVGAGTRYFHGGWGKISAAASTQYVIDRWKPDLLVNLGTCGGFTGRIERGTVVLAERTLLYDIIEQMEDPDEAIAHYTTDLDLSWLPEDAPQTLDNGQPPKRTLASITNRPLAIVRGLLVSADRDIVADEIEDLVEKYDAVAADWESGAIAWVADRNGVRCLILRGVTDLVSAEGGEAYADISVFHENTRKVMRQLIAGLPAFLKNSYAKDANQDQENLLDKPINEI